MNFSIRYKFLLVITFLLMLCVGTYLGMATFVFKADKEELVFDYKRTIVTNISSDVEKLLRTTADKLKLIAYLQSLGDKHSFYVKELLGSDSNIIFVSQSSDYKDLGKLIYQNKTFSETYAIDQEYFSSELNKKRPIPFDEIRKHGEALWNASLAGGPPLIGYGRTVIQEDIKGEVLKQFAFISYLKLDSVLNAMKRTRLNEVFITNAKSELLAHVNINEMQKDNIIIHDNIITKAKEKSLKTSVLSYEDNGHQMLGAFSKAFKDRILVLSKIDTKNAFAVVNRFMYRSMMFSLIVVTVAFIAAIMFSQNLTRPLNTLMKGMGKVSEGDLTTQINVKSNDEIKILAKSFNSMIKDLRESRDELEEINRELENKVKERTKQLEEQNIAVKEAQEALIRTSRLAAVGEIAGRAAHEVLNPLTSIITRIEKVKKRIRNQREDALNLLQDISNSWEDEFTKGGIEALVADWKQPSSIDPNKILLEEDLENIKYLRSNLFNEFSSIDQDADFLLNEGRRINKIVQSMRSLNRVSSEKEELPLNELVNDSVKIMADLATNMNVELRWQKCDPSLATMVDKDEFIQAMTNLLRNSLQALESHSNSDYEKPEKYFVEINEYHDEQHIYLNIFDNGIGISSENKKKLFESQFTTKTKDEGTGLGLSISRRFIRAFNGDIYLQSSELGKGTEFVIKLPIVWMDNRKVSA